MNLFNIINQKYEIKNYSEVFLKILLEVLLIVRQISSE